MDEARRPTSTLTVAATEHDIPDGGGEMKEGRSPDDEAIKLAHEAIKVHCRVLNGASQRRRAQSQVKRSYQQENKNELGEEIFPTSAISATTTWR